MILERYTEFWGILWTSKGDKSRILIFLALIDKRFINFTLPTDFLRFLSFQKWYRFKRIICVQILNVSVALIYSFFPWYYATVSWADHNTLVKLLVNLTIYLLNYYCVLSNYFIQHQSSITKQEWSTKGIMAA